MVRKLGWIAAVLAAVSLAAALAQSGGATKTDYYSFGLTFGGEARCAGFCQEDPKCKAYTYIPPGVQGHDARCTLKNAVPVSTSSDACCITRAKGASTAATGTTTTSTAAVTSQPAAKTATTISLERGAKRAGSTYYAFSLAHGGAERCEGYCMADAKCKAYTYYKPGTLKHDAACELKDAAPPLTVDKCCISGVRGAGSSANPAATGATGTWYGSKDSCPATILAAIKLSGGPKLAAVQKTLFHGAMLTNAANVRLFGAEVGGSAGMITGPTPEHCAVNCLNEEKCIAYTFTAKGHHESGPDAHCSLFSEVVLATEDKFSASGLKDLPGCD